MGAPPTELAATGPDKSALRERLLARRAERHVAERVAVAEALRDHALASRAVAEARRVAVYLSMTTEPGTGPLLDALAERGTEVVVPVVEPGHHLRWVHRDASTLLERSSLGIPEPSSDEGDVGLDGVDVVLVPALAVDHAGHRLGRGAGYYDRALADVDALLVAVVHADELLPDVPHEPHDVAVHQALTEQGVFRVQS